MPPDQTLTDDEREVLEYLRDFGPTPAPTLAYRNLMRAVIRIDAAGLTDREGIGVGALVSINDSGLSALERAPAVTAEDGARDDNGAQPPKENSSCK